MQAVIEHIPLQEVGDIKTELAVFYIEDKSSKRLTLEVRNRMIANGKTTLFKSIDVIKIKDEQVDKFLDVMKKIMEKTEPKPPALGRTWLEHNFVDLDELFAEGDKLERGRG